MLKIISNKFILYSGIRVIKIIEIDLYSVVYMVIIIN